MCSQHKRTQSLRTRQREPWHLESRSRELATCRSAWAPPRPPSTTTRAPGPDRPRDAAKPKLHVRRGPSLLPHWTQSRRLSGLGASPHPQLRRDLIVQPRLCCSRQPLPSGEGEGPVLSSEDKASTRSAAAGGRHPSGLSGPQPHPPDCSGPHCSRKPTWKLKPCLQGSPLTMGRSQPLPLQPAPSLLLLRVSSGNPVSAQSQLRC